jgi:hypothetical protein
MSRIGRLIKRFNRWLAPAAVAGGVEQTGSMAGGMGSSVNPLGVKTVLGEIEQETAGEEDESRSRPEQ